MNRNKIIDKYFVNIELDPEYIDIYYVRKSILASIESNIPNFKGTLLDVGCGIMPYRELVLGKNKKVTSYIGLDFENSLDEEYHLGKPDLFWKGEIIPLNDSSVETIIATEFFEHCPQPESVMLEMLRVLKPGGLLYLTVPFLWNLHLVPYDEYRYTPFSLARHLTNAGFINLELSALGGLDASLAQMIGIWFRNRPLLNKHRKILSYFIMPIVKKLIKADAKVNKSTLFTEGNMITGIAGLAYKA